ncbi:MAG: chemotaxis protein [Marinobacter sp.]|uniref:chemotaxis protein n=1 Tax=Marinobacter sp. TaxID=50741 RepID=UPI00299EF92C|nr:chemotaxis protein [Marinobacter sp.]MDX1757058.1 chemotaxis protein [Marinobacter sp.]
MRSHAHQIQKLLLIQITDRQVFALGTLKIREIIPSPPLTHLPKSHPAVIGSTPFRGAVIPVIDMAAAVGYPPLNAEERKTAAVIVADIQRKEIGFMVRRVDRIIDTDWKKVLPPPRSLGERPFITGLIDSDGQFVQLLDVELLLAEVYPQDVTPQATHLDAVEQETLRNSQILLVDDSQVARRQLSEALDAHAIPYRIAENGSLAKEILFAQSPPVDILVSDIEMPGLDGYELVFDVRDRADIAQPYIILHTSLNSEISVSYAKQVGADEALTKFDAAELLRAMLRGARRG